MALAIAVHLVLLAILVFSIRWQSSPAAPVSAELYAPQVTTPPPRPAVVAVPQPAPPTVKPPPAPVPKPVVAPEPPDTHAADIAMKAKLDDARRKKLEAEKRAELDKQERERKDAERKLAEDKKRAEDKRAEDKRTADARERQQRETNAMLAQAANEAAARNVAAQNHAAQTSASNSWIARIQAKVKGNVILPTEVPGNPTAEFDVTQLPTGEIIDVKLRRSSGVPAYDDAVERAILKSSPLPRPDVASAWQRDLRLVFRPKE